MASDLDLQFTRAALAIVVSPSGKLLVLTGPLWPERPERSLKPDLVGGSVEPGETVEQGLVREIQEETGLAIVDTSLKLGYQHTSPAKYQPGFWHNYFFLARSTNEDVCISDEHSAWQWVEYDEFVGTQWRQSQREAVDFLHQHGILRHYLELSVQ